MKNPKPLPPKPSASASASAARRKSRWEPAAGDKPPSAAASPSDPKPKPKPKPNPNPNPNPNPYPSSSSSAAAAKPKDRSAAAAPPPQASSTHPPPPPSSSAASAAAAGPGGPRLPAPETPPPPTYGFHNLERRTIVLADGTVRSYFALPPDYPPPPSESAGADRHAPYVPSGLPPPPFDRPFPPPHPDAFRDLPPFLRGGDYWPPLGVGAAAAVEGGKRKYPEDDELAARHRQHVLQYGNSSANPNGFPPLDRYYDEFRAPKHARLGGDGFDDFPSLRRDVPPVRLDVDRQALRRAFLKYTKLINENPSQRRNYLDDGRNGPLHCLVCGRASKDIADVHGLIMHAYNSPHADSRVDHLGLHKALCVLMGWDYGKTPENSKAYQSLPADIAQANREDLILWPPTVVIHNTSTGRRKDGRIDGMGNKEMDTKIKELGFPGGKSKSLYGKEGHLGVTLVKFANNQAGLKEAERLAEFLEREDHGRRGWARALATRSVDIDKNPMLVKMDDRTGEKKRIFYGYLATASDLDDLDPDTRKRAFVKSRMEFDLSD